MFPNSAPAGAPDATEAASGAVQRGFSSTINFIFFPQCSHSKVRISPTKPAGSGECQTARAFSPHREQTIGLIWASAIYLDAISRDGMTLLRYWYSNNPASTFCGWLVKCDGRHRQSNSGCLFCRRSWLRGRKPQKSSKGRRLPNLSAVVMRFAARHRHKSDKYLGGVLRSQNHK